MQLKKRKDHLSKWVLTKKNDGRYKARLVARGFQQKYTVDFEETYSPVVNINSLRTVLAIAAEKNLKARQFDIKSAFLHGNLNENIYMEIPQGYKQDKSKVCKLLKSLYRLKQAPLMWNIRLTEHLKKTGFQQSNIDQCIFVKAKETQTPVVLVGEHSEKEKEIIEEDYREQVGSLLYLTNRTRPDVGFHVGYCSRHQSNPNPSDYNNIKSILRYLKGTKDVGLEYSKEDGILRAYSDADFAEDPERARQDV